MINKKYRMYGGLGHEVTFFEQGMEKKPSPGLMSHIELPPIITKDIIAFGAKYVESRENLNKAYFANDELLTAYPSIPFKALDVEHNLENIVGHIYSSRYIDRASNKILELEDLQKLDAQQLLDLTIDVLVGGVVYVDRFPMLESPVSEKRYAISMECYFDSFDILLENGVKVSLEEAEALGWNSLIDQLLGSFETKDALDAAHQIKVILADKSEIPMKVFKWLKGLLFSGGGLVLNPACPSCHIISTSNDNCNCEDEADKGDEEASLKTQADTLLTINLTELDSYMKTWRESKDGKPLNHQVVTVVDNEINKDTETSEENNPQSVAEPDGKTRDPLAVDKGPARCPQYKYEIWTQRGEGENVVEEQQRHWCIYANEKCPTAGDRTWHECLRWYKRENDWIQDMRNFRDSNNPFAPEGTEEEGENSIMLSSSLEFKKMSAMVDSFLYKVEALQLEREAKEKKKEKAAVWTTQYVNGLPNSSFACVEKGYKEGENKNARHLPFKDASGKVDLPHLRNALARCNQIKSVLGTESDSALRARAAAKLESYRSRLKTEGE